MPWRPTVRLGARDVQVAGSPPAAPLLAGTHSPKDRLAHAGATLAGQQPPLGPVLPPARLVYGLPWSQGALGTARLAACPPPTWLRKLLLPRA